MARPLEDRIRHWNEKLEKLMKKQEKLTLKEGHIRDKLQRLYNKQNYGPSDIPLPDKK